MVLKRWTKTEVARLRRLYPHHTNPVIAERMGRSEPAIQQKALKLGLRKSVRHGNAGSFQKGQRPWNAGMKGWQPRGAERTQFKPGNRPQTWLPVGTVVTDSEGYLKRKVADTRIRRRDWVYLHVEKWQKHRGPVPKGHAVVFRNGDKTDIRLGNLELVSRAELMRRNSVHRLPKELAQVVQLVGALNRQINARTR